MSISIPMPFWKNFRRHLSQFIVCIILARIVTLKWLVYSLTLTNMIKVMIIIVPTLFFALFLLLCSPPYFDNMILFASAERIRGNSTNDNLTGTPDNDRITGSGGNDTLIGLAGSDEIDGGAGTDIITGSVGDDYLTGGQNSDVIRGEEGDDEAEGN